jgi:hypothetical protein
LKFLTQPATVAFGLANLFLLSLTGPLISPEHDLVYHLIGASSSIFVPIVAYLAVLWLLLTALLTLAERPAQRSADPSPTHPPKQAAEQPAHPRQPHSSFFRLLTWYFLLFTLPWSLLHTSAGFAGWPVPAWLDLLFAALGLAGLLSLLLLRTPSRRVFDRLQPPIATILGFFALTGLFILGQLLVYAWQARDLNPPTALRPAAATSHAPHPRVLWIVLDELSYQQVYERRFPGLDLSAFDQLAAQSTNFTHVVPAGEFTRDVLPTFFTGIPSDRIRVDGRGMLLALHTPANPDPGKPNLTGSVSNQTGWQAFDPHQTIFQDALDDGYRTGLAGWYNPYCRILPNLLDSCYWVYHEATPADLSPNRTAARNLFRPFRRLNRRLHYVLYRLHLGPAVPPSPSEDLEDIRMHAADYSDLLAAGDTLLNDPSLDFVFLHLPIPHPFGFYDRRTHSISPIHTSYIDNLALSNVYLAHIRQLLSLRHEWDSTTIVLMGDHSWRTSFIWADSGTWTEEDALASHHGEFDDRPAYLVKLPNQQTPAHIDAPFDAIRTRALLDALLAHQLQTPADLTHWSQPAK